MTDSIEPIGAATGAAGRAGAVSPAAIVRPILMALLR